MYEIIYLKQLYDDPNLTIQAGFINQEDKPPARDNLVSLHQGQRVLLFLYPKTPQMLFSLRTSARYHHVLDKLFCVTASPVGPIRTVQARRLSEGSQQKLQQWLKHELQVLGL